MPTIARPLSNRKIKVAIYPDHAPPHFHIFGPGWSVVVRIDNLVVTRGEGPSREIGEVLTWAKDNDEFLQSKWTEFNEQG